MFSFSSRASSNLEQIFGKIMSVVAQIWVRWVVFDGIRNMKSYLKQVADIDNLKQKLYTFENSIEFQELSETACW